MREFLDGLGSALQEIIYGILKFIMSWISIVDDTPSAPPPSKSEPEPFNPYSRSAWKKKAWKQFKQ